MRADAGVGQVNNSIVEGNLPKGGGYTYWYVADGSGNKLLNNHFVRGQYNYDVVRIVFGSVQRSGNVWAGHAHTDSRREVKGSHRSSGDSPCPRRFKTPLLGRAH